MKESHNLIFTEELGNNIKRTGWFLIRFGSNYLQRLLSFVKQVCRCVL